MGRCAISFDRNLANLGWIEIKRVRGNSEGKSQISKGTTPAAPEILNVSTISPYVVKHLTV